MSTKTILYEYVETIDKYELKPRLFETNSI
jgi:hypothetical protein